MAQAKTGLVSGRVFFCGAPGRQPVRSVAGERERDSGEEELQAEGETLPAVDASSERAGRDQAAPNSFSIVSSTSSDIL